MIHQFRDKKQIAKKKRLIKNIFFLIFFLVLASTGVFAYTTGFFHFIGRPLWSLKKVTVDNIENVGYIVHSKASIYKENKNLLDENANLRVSMINYNILKDENLKLKELFNRIAPGEKFILSNILTKPNYSAYDTIIIDTGIKDGLSIGDNVYSNEIIPIGEISIAYDKTSLVTLYSNPGKVTGAMMEGTNTNVELVGRGGGNFEMMLPIDLPFTLGSFVYLPNFQSEVIAIMKDVISSPNDPVKKILLSSPINVQNLKWVFVKPN